MLAVLLLNRMSTKRRIALKQRELKKLPKEVKELEPPQVVYCRTCLSTDDLEPIFTSKENEKKRAHELKLVTGLEIKMDDGLSQQICTNCLATIKKALQFRRMSKKSEKQLLNMTTPHKTKKKYKTRKKLIKPVKMKEIEEDKIEIDIDCELYDDNYQDVDFGCEDGYQNDNGYQSEAFQNDNVTYDVENDKENGDGKEKAVGRKKRGCMGTPPSYKCNTCNKEFRMKATYKAHMRFHTNYRICETCGKRCRNNNQLQEHKRARHGLGRIHKCAYCDYSSATKEALTIHERRHTGERPYVCDHCGATFHRRSNLVQHIAIHLPEKNFQCNICNKREKSKKLLQVHSYKVHRVNRYKYVCPACGDWFTRPGNVRQHLVRSHGVARTEQGAIEKFEVNVATDPCFDSIPTIDQAYCPPVS